MVKHCALIAIFYGAVVIDDYPLSRVKIISIRSDHVRRATAHHAFEMKLKYNTIDKKLASTPFIFIICYFNSCLIDPNNRHSVSISLLSSC